MTEPQHAFTCSRCGTSMTGPGDWGKCYETQACLQRQVDDLKKLVARYLVPVGEGDARV